MGTSEAISLLDQSPIVLVPTPTTPNPLITALLQEFRKANPAITRSGLTELRLAGDGRYVAVAWGSTSDQVFRGRFDEWLLGVFLVDGTLSRVERALDVMPTPRWNDFHIWIDTLTPYRVTVLGRGSTYGDGPIRRVYEIGDQVGPELVEASRKVTRLPPSGFPQLPPVIRRQLEADGCQVPQSPTERGRHNVVSGHFAAVDQLDWAVLCSIDGSPTIRIYWGGYASCRDPVVEWIGPDWGLLDDLKLTWNVVIRPMTAGQAATAAQNVGAKLAAPAHEAIFERYCENGTWIDLQVH